MNGRVAPTDMASMAVGEPVSWSLRIAEKWRKSLRLRLLALGLMPLLIAFPVIFGILVLVVGQRADAMLVANLRGSLVGAGNYLEHTKAEAGLRVSQLVKSERLVRLASQGGNSDELHALLMTAAEGGGFDYLLIARADGGVVASSRQVEGGARLPDSYVVRLARTGVANAGFERIGLGALSGFAPDSAAVAVVPGVPAKQQAAMVIHAAAHFPLTVNGADAILLGGILLNKNTPLIEHLREVVFPVGALPGDADGLAALYQDNVLIAVSRQRQQGQRTLGSRTDDEVTEAVLGHREQWIGGIEIGGVSHRMAFQAIVDGDGRRIGMVSAGVPDGYYQRQTWLLLGVIAAMLALTMLGLSVLFLRAGRELTRRLGTISNTMHAVSGGQRNARVPQDLSEDEISRLGQHFNQLLTTISIQDELGQMAVQAVADEASRRRTLFEHVRDGVVILNPDGSVFEANPRAAAMLGYRLDGLMRTHVADWDLGIREQGFDTILAHLDMNGSIRESLHRRIDGSEYMAEVAISRSVWAERTFVLLLIRDISDRKAAEAELHEYRSSLERLVELRTKELNDRSEQLSAIFALSPDGFVSFDRQGRISFLNAAFLRMTGLTRDELMGLDEHAFSEMLRDRSLPTAPFPGTAQLKAARQVVDDQGDEVETAGRRKLFELQVPANRVLEVGIRLSESPNVAQILYFRDISHETEVDRMKSEFLSVAAHELRTPMSSIYGFAQLLMLKQFEPERTKEMMKTIVRQSELMISIINELLDLARIEARRGKDFVIAQVDVLELVQEVVAGFNVPLDRSAPDIIEGSVQMIIDADRRKMQQALLNIVSNAYKYSPQGGPVSIALIDDPSVNTAQRIGIRVSDRGLGMTPEQLGRVFERFFRADTSGNIPGTGLGMCVVKEIVELHGGEVQVASEYGVGTTVTIWIPVSRQVVMGPTQPPTPEEKAEALDTW